MEIQISLKDKNHEESGMMKQNKVESKLITKISLKIDLLIKTIDCNLNLFYKGVCESRRKRKTL